MTDNTKNPILFKMEEIENPDKPFGPTEIIFHYHKIGNTKNLIGVTTNGKFVRACDTQPKQHIVINIPAINHDSN